MTPSASGFFIAAALFFLAIAVFVTDNRYSFEIVKDVIVVQDNKTGQLWEGSRDRGGTMFSDYQFKPLPFEP